MCYVKWKKFFVIRELYTVRGEKCVFEGHVCKVLNNQLSCE